MTGRPPDAAPDGWAAPGDADTAAANSTDAKASPAPAATASAIPAPAEPKLPPFALLIALTTLGPTSANMFVPSIPSVQQAMATSYATAQLTLTVFLGCFALALLAYGPLSDRYGRRNVLLISIGIYVVGSVLCMVAPTVETLIMGRGVQAAGGCAGFSLSRAMVRDVHRERSAKVIAYLSMAMALGPMVAPAFGGYLDVWFGWRAPFWAMTAAGAVLLVAAWFHLNETRPGTPRAGMVADLLNSFARLLSMRRYLGYTLQIAATSSMFFAFVGAMPLVMVAYFGRPTSDYGLYFMMMPTMFMTGSFIAGRCAGTIGTDTMIRIGSALVLLGASVMVFIAAEPWVQPVHLFAAAATVTLGTGITQANSLAGAVGVDARIAGAAAGRAGSLQTATNAFSSLLVGFLVSGPPAPMAWLMLVGAVLGIVVHTAGTWRGRAG